MGQLTLFDASETLLVDDERGRIAFIPAFIDADAARAWFVEIRAGVRWRAARRMMTSRATRVCPPSGMCRSKAAVIPW